MNFRVQVSLLIIFLILICSCAAKDQNVFKEPSLLVPKAKAVSVPQQPSSKTEKKFQESKLLPETERVGPHVSTRGTKVVHLPSQKKTKQKKRLQIVLDFENADLLEFLDLILLKTLKRNYAVDPQARAKITAHLKGRFSPDELLRLLNLILEMHNLHIIEENNLLRVIPLSKMGRLSHHLSFAIVRFEHVPVQSVINLVKNLSSQQAFVFPDRRSNSLVIVDQPAQLRKVIRLVSLLDVDVLGDCYLEIYRSRVLAVEKLASYLEKIFRSSVFKLASPKNYVDFIPVKELGALLIVSKKEDTLELVHRWIEMIDNGESQEEQVYVYYVENGDAEEIANILKEAFSENRASPRETIVKAIKKSNKKSQQIGTSISGRVRIIPDKTNNLLIITATPEDYRIVLDLLKKIDIVPRQVLIEVIIAEISLNKKLEYGVEWWLKTNFNLEGRKYTGDIMHVGKYAGTPGTGFSYVVYHNLDPRVLITALDNVSEVHILSNPVILATDNREARIQIGQEIPTVTQKVANTASSNLNVTQSIQYRDTGIIVEVKPHINSSGLVKLDITQEVSEQAGTLLDSPIISTRKIKTSLVVQDGHTIILGGLIKQKRDYGESGVPGLMRLPVVGHLFKWGNRNTEKTELLVAITPRVIKNLEEAEASMKEFKSRIEDLKRRLSQEFGK